MTFGKILIANRSEIACRIARTAREFGLRTVAVFSDADADAPHVHAADEAVRIGPASARESYLNIPAILPAAQRSGAGRAVVRGAAAGRRRRASAAAGAGGREACGAARLIPERAAPPARHIEIQIFADAQGNVIHLGERDCSIQRRHQKVIEEAPSPAGSPELRGKIAEAAGAAARASRYRGAGTIEFLLDSSVKLMFLE